ncbi:uncharacterized protein LOC106714956 isoform X2 [Papilio machaon]|uniref:uncharacterized protein LOC106714956 isoform X2 n=1 Tax=Papilio machaon TaxID=76193 RepID=UPI001E6656CB|nr:uncharacterized protein LOC106714956 isoform X2 [Papilio machaon]
MDWSTCSPDIILLIFKYLDHKSLVNCLSVCKSWRDVADYHAEVKGIWPELAQLAMYNKGFAFKQRSILPWRDLYFNNQLWNNRNVHFQVDKIMELVQCKHMHVFEDNIIIIVDSGMIQYKVDTLEQILEEKCVLDYQKTHCIIGKLAEGNILSVKMGNIQKDFCIICHSFILINDHCLAIEAGNIFTVIRCCSSMPIDKSIRFKKAASLHLYSALGTIRSANVDNDIIYVVNKEGRILKLKDMDFLVRSEDGSKTVKVSNIGDTGEIIVECSGLSCVTPHGDILLLGYEDGEVRAYLPKKMLITKEPLFTFNIKDLVMSTLKDAAIKAIEVYEAKESHYLFIATRHEFIKVIVTYDN